MTTGSANDAAEVRAQQERAYPRRRRRALAAKLLAGPVLLAVFLLAFRDWRPAAQREGEDRRDWCAARPTCRH